MGLGGSDAAPQLIRLRIIGDMPEADIAREFNVTTQAVSQHFCRLRSVLRVNRKDDRKHKDDRDLCTSYLRLVGRYADNDALFCDLKYAVILGRHVPERLANCSTEDWRNFLGRRLVGQLRFIETEVEVATNVRPLTAFAPPKFLQELIPRQVKDAFGSFAVKSVVIMCVAHLETQFRRMPA